ncbi:MAG: hypothetical protein OXC80_10625 [Gammaproteobacteria bacterium]|nr:hypothetical protein [Gammaproteobacteria bacterium]
MDLLKKFVVIGMLLCTAFSSVAQEENSEPESAPKKEESTGTASKSQTGKSKSAEPKTNKRVNPSSSSQKLSPLQLNEKIRKESNTDLPQDI